MQKEIIKTPCVGRCSTVYGDNVCRGCKRFHHEVIDWNQYSDQQKILVLNRLEQLIIQVMQDKLIVFDNDLLKNHLINHQVFFNPSQSPYCWAYQLLQFARHTIRNFADCGIMLDARFLHLSNAELKLKIDEDFYQISAAHFDRYFAKSAGLLRFE